MSRLIARPFFLLLLCVGFIATSASGDDPAATRPEMKRRVEALKLRQSRLPLPPITPEEAASGRSVVNNARLRALYLPPSWQSFSIAGWGGQQQRGKSEPSIRRENKPDYAFKTRLFWVVSRTNDCQYCLGHQESKLKSAGMTEDEIASLDCRWDAFPHSERSAMVVARRMTMAPHELSDAELAALKSQFDPQEVIDLLYTIARYNCVNRWTSATGIPQDEEFGGHRLELDSPTSEAYRDVRSSVAPFDHMPRPEWESQVVFEQALRYAATRSPLVPLPSLEQARRVLARDLPGVTPSIWFQAISQLPVALDVWAQRQGLARDGVTASELRILISWVTARENRAWYAAALALERCRAAGLDEPSLYSFEDIEALASAPGHSDALRFARKLTSAPHLVSDDDIERLKPHFSSQEIAEIIHLVADANGFDRFTESLRLPLDSPETK